MVDDTALRFVTATAVAAARRHGVTPAAQFSTTIVPFIDGWIVQWYGEEPAVGKGREKLASRARVPESQLPSSAVQVCAAPSKFVAVTVVPTAMRRTGGEKEKLRMASAAVPGEGAGAAVVLVVVVVGGCGGGASLVVGGAADVVDDAWAVFAGARVVSGAAALVDVGVVSDAGAAASVESGLGVSGMVVVVVPLDAWRACSSPSPSPPSSPEEQDAQASNAAASTNDLRGAPISVRGRWLVVGRRRRIGLDRVAIRIDREPHAADALAGDVAARTGEHPEDGRHDQVARSHARTYGRNARADGAIRTATTSVPWA